jgi:hypothetical protein
MKGALALYTLCVAAACGEPTYVSLGSNDSATSMASPPDAGPPCVAPNGSAATADFACVSPLDQAPTCSFGEARVELAGACDARPMLPCPELGETPEQTLSAILSSLLRECGQPSNVLTVRFEQGCALGFELESAELGAPTSRTCISDRLAAQRFECARDIACADGATFAVPTE